MKNIFSNSFHADDEILGVRTISKYIQKSFRVSCIDFDKSQE